MVSISGDLRLRARHPCLWEANFVRRDVAQELSLEILEEPVQSTEGSHNINALIIANIANIIA